MMACFEATYPASPGTPRRPAVDDMLTIDPPPDSTMAGISYFMHRKVPRTFTARDSSNPSTERSARGAGGGPPAALLKAPSSRPYFSTVCLTSASTEAGSLTSTRTASASPPASRISPPIARIKSSVRAANTTLAPSAANARAEAAPMPRLAPVTMMTLPSRRRVLTTPSVVAQVVSDHLAEHRHRVEVMGEPVLRQRERDPGRGVAVGEAAANATDPEHRV